MKIIDRNDKVILNPDLGKGYIQPGRLLIAHHDAVPPVEEQWHMEAYDTNEKGTLYNMVVDVPAQPAKDAWDEYEDVQRYIEYTPEELAERNKPTQEQRLASVESAVLGIMRILRGGK